MTHTNNKTPKGKMRMKTTTAALLATAAIITGCSTGTQVSHEPQPRPTQIVQPPPAARQAPERAMIKITEAQGPAVTIVRKYLAAAGRQDALASKSFLSTNCKDDMVVECQANAQSGWNYSEQDTSVESEVISADGRSATVKAEVVFKGGSPPTFMGTKKTFFLVLENGDWKVSGMDPKPRQVGPGVRPL